MAVLAPIPIASVNERDRGKPGTLPEGPQTVAQVSKQFVHSGLDERGKEKFRNPRKADAGYDESL